MNHLYRRLSLPFNEKLYLLIRVSVPLPFFKGPNMDTFVPFKRIIQKEIVDSSEIRTWIIEVEGERADQETT